MEPVQWSFISLSDVHSYLKGQELHNKCRQGHSLHFIVSFRWIPITLRSVGIPALYVSLPMASVSEESNGDRKKKVEYDTTDFL